MATHTLRNRRLATKGLVAGIAAAALSVGFLMQDRGGATATATAVPTGSATIEVEAALVAQPLSRVVTGRVSDAATGRPLENAQVYAVGTGWGALTDPQGRFVIPVRGAVPDGQLVVRAELIGYAAAEDTVSIDPGRGNGDTVVVDFALAADAVDLSEIVVSGSGGVVAQNRAIANRMSRVAPVRPSSRAEREQVDQLSVPRGPAAKSLYGARFDDAGGRFVRRRDPLPTNESYARIVENPFLAVSNNPLSTFGVDVDRASYSNVRRFLEGGQRPPSDAVRIEELINYFEYDYEGPGRRHPFAVHTEVMRAPWNRDHHLVRIGLQGRRLDAESLPPSNLVFLIDVSGSMSSANKLPLVKQSLHMLVDNLREQDRVAIVVYAGAAGLVLPSTSGAHKREILDAIERLQSGGSTAGGEGIRLAYDVASEHHQRRGNNRVILATDGDFNVGASSDDDMVRLIEERREQGTFLTVLGYGTGNLKDSKMEALADHGNGNFAYIDDLDEARKVLVAEMGGTLHTIAKDVKLQVEFNPDQVAAYRLIGYENRVLAAEDFNDDQKDAGDMGAGHSVTALYEVIPAGHETYQVRGTDPLRYQSNNRWKAPWRRWLPRSDELGFLKLRYKQPDGSRSRLLEVPIDGTVEDRPTVDTRFAAAVAGFGMVLRGSEHVGDWRLGDVVRLAEGALGPDLEGYRADFLKLVDRARSMERVADHDHESEPNR